MDIIDDWYLNHLDPRDPGVITGLDRDDFDSEEEYGTACKTQWDSLTNDNKISIWKSLNHDKRCDDSGRHLCRSCGERRSGIYVLVEFPDDSAYFENNDIGYPCFNSEDNGARYVPETDYLNHFHKEPPQNSYFRPVRWPQSQEYMQGQEDADEPDDSILALCEPIEDESGLENFGPSALWAPLSLIIKIEESS